MKWKLLTIALTLALLFVAFHLFSDSRISQPLTQVVSELGPPAFLAQSTEVYRRKGKILRIDVLENDPRTIQNWASITNGTAIWTTSDYAKSRAGLFYNNLKNDRNFDGTAWISPDTFGTKLTILQFADGRVSSARRVRVAGISVRLVGVSGPAVYGLRGNDRLRMNEK